MSTCNTTTHLALDMRQRLECQPVHTHVDVLNVISCLMLDKL